MNDFFFNIRTSIVAAALLMGMVDKYQLAKLYRENELLNKTYQNGQLH